MALIDRIIETYQQREADLAQLIAQEVGIPISFRAQVAGPVGHMQVARDVIATYAFERELAGSIVRREPIGVCALISPWNWPIQTSVIKVIYGIAAGCTMVARWLHDGCNSVAMRLYCASTGWVVRACPAAHVLC